MLIWLRKLICSEILLGQFFSKAFKNEADCWNCHTSMPSVCYVPFMKDDNRSMQDDNRSMQDDKPDM